MSAKLKTRIGEKNINQQDCLMEIVEYNGANDILIEFQDDYCAKVKTKYCHFINGKVKNPYYPSILGVGIVGNLYPTIDSDGNHIKEYTTWCNMLKRCFDKKEKEKHITYKDATCCDDWLIYGNFYEWATTQSNYNLWKYGGNKWHLDKDILSKSFMYSPETCCFVPHTVNTLFNKQKPHRGNLPIGVEKSGNGFSARCRNPFQKNKRLYFGTYSTMEDAFDAYKHGKEDLIKQVALIEFEAGNITEECYNAMMKYEVEITD